MTIEFNHFEKSEGTTAKVRPTHALALLTMTNREVYALLHPTGANGFPSSLTTAIVLKKSNKRWIGVALCHRTRQ